MKSNFYAAIAGVLLSAAACQSPKKQEIKQQDSAAAKQPVQDVTTGSGDTVTLPPPFKTKSVKNFSDVIGWAEGKSPVAPAGFIVTKFAANIDNARQLYVLPNGDVLAALAKTESKGVKKAVDAATGRSKSIDNGKSPNMILLFKNIKDGIPAEMDTFLANLNQPFGMVLAGNYFYVANTDAVWRYPYQTGQTRLRGNGEKILTVPAAGYNNHWVRNLIANKDGSKIYVTVGSGSNAGEHGIAYEDHRANIIEINPDGSSERIYASGMRNPIGMGWAPGTSTLWASVNERDELGDDLVPDYLTSVKEGGFYGWPFSYYGQHIDPRIPAKEQRPDLVQKAIVPDVPLGSHTASIGLAFYTSNTFPAKYRGGAFIGQHGSWNRSSLAGYKVLFVPFVNGKPGKPEDFLTGFIADEGKNQVYGRPVGLAVMNDGSLLVADDAGNTIWRVSAVK